MVKQKSQDEIAAEIARLKQQVKECENCDRALVKIKKTWESLNENTRKTFKESTFYETLNETLRKSDVLAEKLHGLVGKVREQSAGFKERQENLKEELQSLKLSQKAEQNHRNPRQSK